MSSNALSFALLGVFCLRTGLACAEWTRLAEDKEGKTIYIDQATLQRKDDIATLWALFDYRTDQLVDGVSSKSAKAKLNFDCLAEKLRISSMSFHAGNMGLGKTIDTDLKQKQWEPISPNTMGGSSFDYACSIFSADGAKHKYSQDVIPKWKQGPSTSEADVFFDPKSTTRIKNKVSMSIITNFKMPIDIESKLIWSARAKSEFDCIKQSSRYSDLTYFDLPYGKGGSIVVPKSSPNPWKPISENGLSMGMWNIACNS